MEKLYIMYNVLSVRTIEFLNSGANVSRIISDDTFRKLCGCTCDVKSATSKVEAPKQVKKQL